jgi:hypothetical protein
LDKRPEGSRAAVRSESRIRLQTTTNPVEEKRMKIQEFCSKIREDKNDLFQALRGLRKIETRVLLDDGEDALSWDPWTRMVSPEPLVV